MPYYFEKYTFPNYQINQERYYQRDPAPAPYNNQTIELLEREQRHRQKAKDTRNSKKLIVPGYMQA